MAITPLSGLLVTYTTSQASSQLLTSLAGQDPPLPTTSWQSGSTPQVLVASFSTTVADLYQARYDVTAGGYLGTASGDWLTLLASENYNKTRIEAVTAKGFVLFTNAGGSPATVIANSTTVGAGTRTYRALVGGSVPAGSTLYLPVEAVASGAAGNVANNAITVMTTAIAGVTCANPVPWLTISGDGSTAARGYLTVSSALGGVLTAGAVFTDGTHSYTGLEGVTLTAGGSAEILIEATATGSDHNVGPGIIDTVTSSSVADLTCANDPATDNLSTWIYRAGSDQETDTALRTRCRNLLLARGISWTKSGIIDQIQECPLTSGTVVTRALVDVAVYTTGVVGAYPASSAGGLTFGDMAELQAWMDDRRSLGSQILMYSATGKTVIVTATITIPSGFLSQAQTEVAETLAALASSTPVGGDPRTSGYLLREDIIAAIKRAQYDASGAQTNPSAAISVTMSTPAADVSLDSTYVPIFTTNFTWVEV